MSEPLTAAELAALRRGEGLDPARLGPYEVTSRLLDTVEALARELTECNVLWSCGGVTWCIFCEAHDREDVVTHEPDCLVTRALALLG